MKSIYDIEVKTIDGKTTTLADYRGKVMLIVNVASKCGFTPQYSGLETLFRKYREKGFVVLGFPSNEFGGQEPGTSQQIKFFCQENYDVTFPLFEKIKTNGKEAHPLYVYLKSAEPGVLGTEAIKWNFTKFLIDRKGEPVTRYASATKPEDLTADIEALL